MGVLIDWGDQLVDVASSNTIVCYWPDKGWSPVGKDETRFYEKVFIHSTTERQT